VSDELLKEAARALKEESDGTGDDGRFTRARVLVSLNRRKRERRARLAFILPIAACLAVGSAWAAATGRLPAVIRALTHAVSFRSRVDGAKPSAAVRSGAPLPAQNAEPVPKAVEAAPSAVEAPQAPEVVEPKASAKPAPSAASSAAFRDADGDLYRLAHRAHFTEHDYARALEAWNAYLSAAPRGRFATEARYNRAICLVRLGRDAEARRALEPFVSGELGYRQNEARQLVDELSK
jgi:TolA-binding protein